MNNVYVRNDKTISSIVLMRVLFLIPVILYGFYKNGIYLYTHKYVELIGLFKPLIILFGGVLISLIIDFIFCLIRKEKFQIGFSLEYAVLLSCIVPIGIKYYIYFPILLVGLILAKFIDGKLNVFCLMFITIYLLTKNFNFANIYERSKIFELSFIDLLLGKASGGIFSTHILLLLIGIIGITICDCNKIRISISSLITVLIGLVVIGIVKKIDVVNLLFINNYIFIFMIIVTNYINSPYTKYGKVIYGITTGILTIAFYFINPVLAPFIAIFITSFISKLFDYKFE